MLGVSAAFFGGGGRASILMEDGSAATVIVSFPVTVSSPAEESFSSTLSFECFGLEKKQNCSRKKKEDRREDNGKLQKI